MKTTSGILTVLMVIPVIGVLFSAFSTYRRMQFGTFGNQQSGYLLWQLLSPIFVYFIFFIVSLYLNAKEKFLENCVMCGTIISSYILFFLLNVISSLVFDLMQGGVHVLK